MLRSNKHRSHSDGFLGAIADNSLAPRGPVRLICSVAALHLQLLDHHGHLLIGDPFLFQDFCRDPVALANQS